ncbi:MAG: hypothetical protein V1647_06405 [Pseudomonadota bacterium]
MKNLFVFLFVLSSFNLTVYAQDDFEKKIVDIDSNLKIAETLLIDVNKTLAASDEFVKVIEEQIVVIDGCIDRSDNRINLSLASKSDPTTLGEEQKQDSELVNAALANLEPAKKDYKDAMVNFDEQKNKMLSALALAKEILDSETKTENPVTEHLIRLAPLAEKYSTLKKDASSAVAKFNASESRFKYQEEQNKYWLIEYRFFSTLLSYKDDSEPYLGAVSFEEFGKAKTVFNEQRKLYLK